MNGAEAPMPSWLELWNEWEIQVVVVASFSLQVILFFFAGIRRYSVSSVLKALLWLVYLFADLAATYALGHMSSSLSKKSSSEHQLVAFWAPFLLLHLGGQDTITAYALEDNELWRRHLLNMFVQVAGTGYVLYKYIIAGGATFARPAMLVLAAGFVKYGERIWALKIASKGAPRSHAFQRPFCWRICCICCMFCPLQNRYNLANPDLFRMWINARYCFTKNKKLGIYAFIVMKAHGLRDILVKPLIIERNEASIYWDCAQIELLGGHAQRYLREDDENGDALAREKRHTGELYKAVEVELALAYDMLYTKAQVIRTWYGYCIRAMSLVSCFVALVVFTRSKRDGYNTSNIAITFALLGGACALEMVSAFKVIGSTWTYAILEGTWGWKWLANAILFARYHLLVVKDGRWSDSVGQFNFISFRAHSHRTKMDCKGQIACLTSRGYMWYKAEYIKRAKLSPAVKEFVWGLLKGDKSDMVRIEDLAIRRGYSPRGFRGFDQSEDLDWSLSFEFEKNVLIWHIATSTFLSSVDFQSELAVKDMAEAVNTLSDYMMYFLVKHPDILPIKAADPDCSLFEKASASFRPYECEPHREILDYNKSFRDKDIEKLYGTVDLTHPSWDDHPGEAVLVKACVLANKMLGMKLDLTHKMAIIGTVWMEMLCYAATNVSGGFHARQLSNGGEFLTHILLLTKYAAAIHRKPKGPKAPDETVEASAPGHVKLTVDDNSNDVNIEIRPI